MAALLKTPQEDSRKPSVTKTLKVLQFALPTGERKVREKDARLAKEVHVFIFHSDASAKRNIKIHFGPQAALCKYTLRPCDTNHLSSSAALAASPVHNLSLRRQEQGIDATVRIIPREGGQTTDGMAREQVALRFGCQPEESSGQLV